jgi:hypothetical protein
MTGALAQYEPGGEGICRAPGLGGYTWDGIFHNGTERGQRRYRVEGNSLALNGGRGEIWRNFFYLLGRSYSPREILSAFYSQFDPPSCTGAFLERDYFYRLEVKLGDLLRQRYSRLARPLVEWLYHNFPCRSWGGHMKTINSTFGYTPLPFLERPLTEHAATIPTGWKPHGAYEAELIRRIDHRLAAYPSGYGHSFAGPPPLRCRLADYGPIFAPLGAPVLLSHQAQNLSRREVASLPGATVPRCSASGRCASDGDLLSARSRDGPRANGAHPHPRLYC